MNVHDKAYELAKAIRESSEFRELKESLEKVNADPDSKRMLDDFRQRQMEFQKKLMSGETPSEEERQKMEKLYEVITLNPAIRKVFESERRLAVIMEDINRIIAAPLQDVMK